MAAPTLRFGVVVTPQMVFSASCNSPKTPQSPTTRVIAARTVATTLSPALRAFSIVA